MQPPFASGRRPRRLAPALVSALAFALAACLALTVLGPGSARAADPVDDPTAEAVIVRLEAALGVPDAWDQARHLTFTFAGARTHWWDRFTGDHRLEGTDREGRSYVVIHRLGDGGSAGGRVVVDGAELDGAERDEWLERAWGAWVNDTYWLLMPYKLRDPGVTVTHEGEVAHEGLGDDGEERLHDVLLLSFDGVGLTPGDRYWIHVDRKSGLVERWAYVLQGQAEPSRTAWLWRSWGTYGPGIRLATERQMVGGERTLPLDDLAVPDDFPAGTFDDPAPMRPADETTP